MLTERFLNAALYFSKNTAQFDTIKLYKLLFLADRDCIKKTGHTITEATYRKIKPYGPVPKEIKALVDGIAAGDKASPHISDYLKVEIHGKHTRVIFTGDANLKYFTPDEIDILAALAKKYETTPSKRIAHGVHFMQIVNSMDWGKDFQMDVFLPQKDRKARQENRLITDKFKLALNHA